MIARARSADEQLSRVSSFAAGIAAQVETILTRAGSDNNNNNFPRQLNAVNHRTDPLGA